MTVQTHLPLPPAKLRWGGPRYADDGVYVQSGITNARMLERECGISAQSRILDIGCGQARLLNGLLAYFGSIGRYVGVDVHQPSISWLKKNVEPKAPFAEFHHVPVANARYNPKGSGALALSIEEQFDCICLFSVFSHMLLADIDPYLRFMASVLAPEGRVFLTLFVEDGVEPETENPDDYHREWTGALHCVRLNRQIFEQMVSAAGLQVRLFKHRHTNDGQSSYVLTRSGQSFSAKIASAQSD